jgi:outer membrane protein TolC
MNIKIGKKHYSLTVKQVKCCLLFVLALVFICNRVYAVQALTLQECITLALTNNDSVHASLSNLEQQQQEVRISRSELFPKFKSNFQYTLFDRAPSFVIEKNAFAPGVPASNAELPAGESSTYAFTLAVEQPLFTGGYLTNRHSRSRMQEKASRMEFKNTQSSTILKVKLAYYDVLKAFKLKETTQHSLKLKEELIRVTGEQYKAGAVKYEELLLVKSEMSRDKLELLKSENLIKIKEKALKNLIGLNMDDEISLAEELENKKLVIGLNESRDMALNNRKDLAASNYMLKSSSDEIKIASSSYYPKSYVTGSYTRQKETPLANPDLWALMLNINWDIFEWGKTKADVKRAEAKHRELTSEYELLKKDIMLEVEDHWFKVAEAEEGVKSAELNLIYAKEHYKNTSLKFNENLLKTAELLAAETSFIKSRNEYINSIYELIQAISLFEFTVSADVTPFLIKESIQPFSEKTSEINMDYPGKTDERGNNENKEKPLPAEIKQIQKESRLQDEKKQDNYDIQPLLESVKPERSQDKADVNANRTYIVQVGAFRNAENARQLLNKLTAYYPNAHIVASDNFNKVRIPGVNSKSQGVRILKELKERFKLEAVLLAENN